MSSYNTSTRCATERDALKLLELLASEIKKKLGPSWQFVASSPHSFDVTTDLVSISMRTGGARIMVRVGTCRPDSQAADRQSKQQLATAWALLAATFPAMEAFAASLAKTVNTSLANEMVEVKPEGGQGEAVD